MEVKAIELTAIRRAWELITSKIMNFNIPNLDYFLEKYHSYKELSGLLDDYNNVAYQTIQILETTEPKINRIIFPKYPLSLLIVKVPLINSIETRLYSNEIRPLLSKMQIECGRTIQLIDEIVKGIALLPSKKEEELKALEREIKNKVEPKFPLFSSELLESIKSLRKGELLGSALICGRIQTVIIEKTKRQIPNLNEISREKRWDTTMDYLRQRKIFEGQEGEMILQAINLYRNKFAHRIGVDPSIEECILIISGETLLTKNVAKNYNEFTYLQRL